MPYSNQKMPTSEDVKLLLDSVFSLGITLHYFETMPDFNRCWCLIVRHKELLFQFFWDGRDEFLLIQETDFSPKANRFIWHPTHIPKVEADEGRETFRYIEEVLKKKFLPNTKSEGNRQ